MFSELLHADAFATLRKVCMTGTLLGMFIIMVLLISIAINASTNNDRNVQMAKEGLKLAIIVTVLLGLCSTWTFMHTLQWAIQTLGGGSYTGDGGFSSMYGGG